ncbi:AAA family ATPase [candidate division KSB1 bacterium]|nr:AAA family ATPase [candidate division KSB1 bacterium]
MYLNFFDLKEEPFATTPDPKFLYKSAVHQEALDRIMTSVSMRRGINAIIGEPGLGKSMLIRTMLKGFSDSVHFAWVFNTNMDSRDLIKYICRDFGFKPKATDLSDLLMELYTFLIKEYEQKNYTILIIDEAQNCTPEVLEEIRQLSNLETVSNKLLQVILSGQPQLDVYLNEPSLHQLKQRISLKATLHRLGWEDTVQYIRHRLQVAGAKRDDIFSEAALGAVYEISDGVPRLINQVCDNALLSAAQAETEQVDSVLIMELVDKGKVVSAATAEDLAKKTESRERERQTKQTDAAEKSSRPSPIAPKMQKPQPAVVLEIMDGFDGVDLGELDTN